MGIGMSRGSAPALEGPPARTERLYQIEWEGTREYDALRELCHDLLQPAATIGAVVAAAQVEADLPAATRARLTQVTVEARRIAELCGQVLQTPSAYSSVRLHELAVDVAASASLRSPGSVSVDAQPATVHGDASALRRALTNLVDNAVRAAGPGGQVSVTSAVIGDRAQLRVADSGEGFGTGANGVAGLGLRIAARVAHEHGGDLLLGTSARLGGAQLTLSIPSTFVDATGDHAGERYVR